MVDYEEIDRSSLTYFKLIFPLKKNLDINSKFLTIYELMI